MGTTSPHWKQGIKMKTLYNYGGFLAIFPYLPYGNMSTEEAISMDLPQSTLKGRNSSECIALLDRSVPEVLDYIYIANYTSPAIKKEVEDIAGRVIEALNETLQCSSWVTPTLLESFQQKLKEIPVRVGYPDKLLDMSALEALYKYVPHFPSDIPFTEALYYISQNAYKMQLRKFRYPQEGNWRWASSPRNDRPLHDKYGSKVAQ
ncbi:neprilysin-2-like isoform X2 [Dermacentor andersoni]|uniref:neprilysin-2-like isoform X2 n=1 Tax=Dermacentor andersoni TaxID=34620 RepID=UPI003B3BD761